MTLHTITLEYSPKYSPDSSVVQGQLRGRAGSEQAPGVWKGMTKSVPGIYSECSETCHLIFIVVYGKDGG